MNRKKFIKTATITLLPMRLIAPKINFFNHIKNKKMTEQKICQACGTQFPENSTVEICTICAEERQYVPEEGQSWMTHIQLSATHKNKITQLNDNLFEIVIEPRFAIGQRAFLVLSKSGNILWDCVTLLDTETAHFIKSKGGLKAIAFSHPHYYSNMNEWAKTFNCPIYIHKKDEMYIVDKGKNVTLWEGDMMNLIEDMSIHNIGGHFEGSSVLLIPSMSKEGIILCGDTMYLSPSMKHFAFMYSYPNRIPLPISEIKRIEQRLNALRFDSIYGFYGYQNVIENAKSILKTSFGRYFL
jgi:glyoxylase-like metal-dependent hydrolase (beta-lactamase superfamily II)